MKGLPRTVKGIKSWLVGSTEGRELFHDLASEAIETTLEARCRICEGYKPNPKVLVVLRRLGRHPGVEVFAEEGVNVRIVELPDFPDDLPAEELIQSYVPRNWVDVVNVAAKRIFSGVFRGISINKALEYSRKNDIARGLKEWKNSSSSSKSKPPKRSTRVVR